MKYLESPSKKKKKPNSEGNFQNQVIFLHSAKQQSTSVVSLGRVQPGTELDGRASQEHKPKDGRKVRASGALGRAFLLLHKCFETEPQCLGPSFLTRDGMLRLCADYELAPLPPAATSVPRPGAQPDPHDPQGSGRLR